MSSILCDTLCFYPKPGARVRRPSWQLSVVERPQRQILTYDWSSSSLTNGKTSLQLKFQSKLNLKKKKEKEKPRYQGNCSKNVNLGHQAPGCEAESSMTIQRGTRDWKSYSVYCTFEIPNEQQCSSRGQLKQKAMKCQTYRPSHSVSFVDRLSSNGFIF